MIDETSDEADFASCFTGEPEGPSTAAGDLIRGRLYASRQQRRRSLAALVLGVVVLGAAFVPAIVGPGEDEVPAAPPSVNDPDPDGVHLPPDAPRRISYGAVTSDPVLGHPPIEVDRAEALREARRHGVWLAGTPDVALRWVAGAGQGTDRDEPRLHWVIVWEHSGPPAHFGGGVSKSEAAARAREEGRLSMDCATVILVAADTGVVPSTTEVCTPG